MSCVRTLIIGRPRPSPPDRRARNSYTLICDEPDFLPDRPDPLEDFCALRDDLSRILERDVDLVAKRAIRNPYFRDSALAQAEVVYVADV